MFSIWSSDLFNMFRISLSNVQKGNLICLNSEGPQPGLNNGIKCKLMMVGGRKGEDNVVMVLLIKDLSFNTSIQQFSIDKEFKPPVASQHYYPASTKLSWK